MPVHQIYGIGMDKVNLIQQELDIFTFGQLLEYYPFRYIDKSKITAISAIGSASVAVQVVGLVRSVQVIGQGRKKRLSVRLQDESGVLELLWFKGLSYFQKLIKPGQKYLVFGKPKRFRNQFSMTHPEIQLIEGTLNVAKVMKPVYSSTEKLSRKGLDSNGIARLMAAALKMVTPNLVIDPFPGVFLEQQKIIDKFHALHWIHQPKNVNEINLATHRIKFEELFLIQFRLLFQKQQKKQLKGFVFETVGERFNRFFDQLPFALTDAQKRVVKEVRRDTKTGAQMNRLIQGDVGSGKTIVAQMAMLIAIDNGFQTSLMAPTEILARQHYEGIKKDFEVLGVRVVLLTGSVKGKARKDVLHYLKEGLVDVVIGTHALIEETVIFKNLGLAVIDEQHRFGVAQRARLWRKNELPPHIMVMTATPIPRTLAMTVYGDLDVSVIDELPPGRKAVQTVHRKDSDRNRVFGFIRDQIQLGRQIYIVYPLIEESATLDYKDLMDGYESVQRSFPMPEYQISIVHGRQKPAEKDFEMQRFVTHETQIMVATTVIEVGVNVPNASVMIIENAERFGLSQLHQLRGRVGRGADQSYCVLMTGLKLSNEARKRISTMVETNDGFKIAEVDMEIRGPGDIEGTRQSGDLSLKLANYVTDQKLLHYVRHLVDEFLSTESDQNIAKVQEYIQLDRAIRGKNWGRIS